MKGCSVRVGIHNYMYSNWGHGPGSWTACGDDSRHRRTYRIEAISTGISSILEWLPLEIKQARIKSEKVRQEDEQSEAANGDVGVAEV